MLKSGPPRSVGRMSDAAVQAKTGKTWPEWFRILDRAGGKKMTHQEIVAYLVQEHALPPWWRQMVTVEYEQDRGLRAKHEMPDGFQISRSKTIPAPVAVLFEAWTDSARRRRWLPGARLTIRRATPNRSLRITWNGGPTHVEVLFYPKGTAKCQVVAQHSKLASAQAAEEMKIYWAQALERLAAQAEAWI